MAKRQGERPSFTVVYKEDGSIEVSIVRWSEINARMLEKALRAYQRERARLRTEALRDARAKKIEKEKEE